MLLRDLITAIEEAVPLQFQESYDNSGLQVGDYSKEIKSALLTLDITEEVVEEAKNKGCDAIISHHPVIFKPLKRLTGRTASERIVAKAIKYGIAIYSAHTNLDVMNFGVSAKMAEKMELTNCKVLVPLKGQLRKLVTFIPQSYFDQVSSAVFEAGAGSIGEYDSTGFSCDGVGTFRGNADSNPFVGEPMRLHHEKERRFETVFYKHQEKAILKALLSNHPYEEVAYDIYPIENDNIEIGFGCVGDLKQPMPTDQFLKFLENVFDAKGIRFSKPPKNTVSRVAMCGGSGSEFLSDAIAASADAYVTADVKYHTFFDAENKILLTDIGHYESEKVAIDILYDLIIKKFPNFALHFSGVYSNPINYL